MLIQATDEDIEKYGEMAYRLALDPTRSCYPAYFGYPGDNRDAVSFLAEHGFKCIEQDWNPDRILETIDDWIIFVYDQADIPAATVFLRGDNGYFEIYGTEFADGTFQENVFRELLAASLNECKRRGAKYMTYF